MLGFVLVFLSVAAMHASRLMTNRLLTSELAYYQSELQRSSWLSELDSRRRPTRTITMQLLPTPSAASHNESSMTECWIPFSFFFLILSLAFMGAASFLFLIKRLPQRVLNFHVNKRATVTSSVEIARLKRKVEKAEYANRQLLNERTTASTSQSQQQETAIVRLKDKVKNTKRTLSDEQVTVLNLQGQKNERVTADSSSEIANLREEVGDKVKEVETQTAFCQDASVELEDQKGQIAELKELLASRTKALDAKQLEVDELRTQSDAAVNTLQGKNERVEKEVREANEKVKRLTERSERAEEQRQMLADEVGELRKKQADAGKVHEAKVSQLLQKLQEAVEARAIPDPTGEVGEQGITGSHHRPTETQPTADSHKVEVTSAAVDDLEEGGGEGKQEKEKKKKKKARRGKTSQNKSAALRTEFQVLAHNLEEIVGSPVDESLRNESHQKEKKGAIEESSSMVGGGEDSSTVQRSGNAMAFLVAECEKLGMGGIANSRWATKGAVKNLPAAKEKLGMGRMADSKWAVKEAVEPPPAVGKQKGGMAKSMWGK